jgi:hypothetical protein
VRRPTVPHQTPPSPRLGRCARARDEAMGLDAVAARSTRARDGLSDDLLRAPVEPSALHGHRPAERAPSPVARSARRRAHVGPWERPRVDGRRNRRLMGRSVARRAGSTQVVGWSATPMWLRQREDPTGPTRPTNPGWTSSPAGHRPSTSSTPSADDHRSPLSRSYSPTVRPCAPRSALAVTHVVPHSTAMASAADPKHGAREINGECRTACMPGSSRRPRCDDQPNCWVGRPGQTGGTA